MTEFKIEGAREIQRVLEEMPRRLQRQALVHAFREGANIVRDEAKVKAATLPDGFAQALIVARPTAKQRRRRGQHETVVVIAFKKGKFSRLAHLFEFGTAERFQKSGRFTGRITAQPFLRPALDTRATAATRKIAETLRDNIEIIARQLRSGQKISLAKKNRNL